MAKRKILRGMQGQGGGMLGAGRACIKALRWETVYLLLLDLLGRQAADETGDHDWSFNATFNN